MVVLTNFNGLAKGHEGIDTRFCFLRFFLLGDTVAQATVAANDDEDDDDLDDSDNEDIDDDEDDTSDEQNPLSIDFVLRWSKLFKYCSLFVADDSVDDDDNDDDGVDGDDWFDATVLSSAVADDVAVAIFSVSVCVASLFELVYKSLRCRFSTMCCDGVIDCIRTVFVVNSSIWLDAGSHSSDILQVKIVNNIYT